MEMFVKKIMRHFVINSKIGNTVICGSLFTGTLRGSFAQFFNAMNFIHDLFNIFIYRKERPYYPSP